uniref:Protein kinase domain-containing protein n=1 Tax=Strigamia maritima TaxID=126957 RepID=T1JH07_STRMM
GAFTVVHRCYEKKSRQQYAARFIRIGRDLGTKEMVFRELEIMHVCQHERLVTFYEAYDLGSYVVMILEYIPNGELADKIVREDPRMTEEDCRQVARQICEGIGFLHRNSIVHLDLKPENVLCMSSESNDVKLIDFGLARRLDPFAGIRILFATPEFCAPEVVNYETVGFPTDMWSIGVITFVMLSGTSPFLGEDDDETLTNVSDASWDFQEDCWENISFEAKDLITRLLVKAKDGRLTIEDALRHPWIQV